MKSLSILTAFASTGAFASAINYANLQDRAIDPATMNPTLLSVLSVLKTAMPTGPNAPMPTGDLEPNWYQQLPGDVKSLLPELYPAAAAVATSEAGAGVVSQAQSTDAVVSAPTTTGVVSPSSSVPSSDSASPTTSSTTLASASATPSNSPSTGNRFAVKTGTLAAIAMFSVGAGFCIFA